MFVLSTQFQILHDGWHFHFWLSSNFIMNFCIHKLRNPNVSKGPVWLYPFPTHTLLLKIVQEALGHCNFLAISWCKKKLKRENFQLSIWTLFIHWEKYRPMVKKNQFLESVLCSLELQCIHGYLFWWKNPPYTGLFDTTRLFKFLIFPSKWTNIAISITVLRKM